VRWFKKLKTRFQDIPKAGLFILQSEFYNPKFVYLPLAISFNRFTLSAIGGWVLNSFINPPP
jgi:hypothetical protein